MLIAEEGRAIARAISRRFFTVQTRVPSQSNAHVGFVDTVTMARGFHECFGFALSVQRSIPAPATRSRHNILICVALPRYSVSPDSKI